jgi:hypothetical protein
MSGGVYWTRHHERYALANADTMPLKQIAADLDRTVASVKARIEVLRAISNPAVIEEVRHHWGVLSPRDIAAKIKVDSSAVYRIAKSLGLGRSGFGTGAAEGTEASLAAMSKYPSPPRGYSEEELAWAHANNGDHPEAGMMLLFHRHWRAWRRGRLRNKQGAAA